MPKTVDEFIAARVLPEHRATVAMLRALILDLAPDAVEAIR